MEGSRLERVGRLLQQELATLIVGREIKDPRVSPLLSIVDVQVSKDLAYARVRVAGYLPPERLEKGVEGLNNAAGFLQARIAARVHMKATPKLTFVADHSVARSFEVTRTLDGLTEGESGEIPEEDRPDTTDDAPGDE